jgi:hypothetical protein
MPITLCRILQLKNTRSANGLQAILNKYEGEQRTQTTKPQGFTQKPWGFVVRILNLRSTADSGPELDGRRL